VHLWRQAQSLLHAVGGSTMNDQQGGAGVVEIGLDILSIDLDCTSWMIKMGFRPRRLSAQRVRRAMSKNMTVTWLNVRLSKSSATMQQNGADPAGFVQFLQQYIVSRTHLQDLILSNVGGQDLRAAQQILMAAAGSESIRRLHLGPLHLSVLDLYEFCRANRNVKRLEFDELRFSLPDEAVGATCITEGGHHHQASRTIPQLEMLDFQGAAFETRPAALMFLNHIAPGLKTTALKIGHLQCDFDGGGAMMSLILSSLFAESRVKRLHLGSICPPEVFSAALKAGKTSVESLFVEFGRGGENKLETLAKILPEMAEVKILDMTFYRRVTLQHDTKKRVFRAVDQCPTLTEIRVNEREGAVFSPEEMRLLQNGRLEQQAPPFCEDTHRISRPRSAEADASTEKLPNGTLSTCLCTASPSRGLTNRIAFFVSDKETKAV